MNCDEVKKSLGALHDGAANERLKNQTENHLSACLSCRAAFDRLRALSVLLHKDVAPQVSPLLDRKLMQAFRAKHERPAKSAAWWKTLFAGSISVPKPVFAAALIVFALSIGWANLSGRDEPISAVPNDASTSPVVSAPIQPQALEEIKIVEVPVIKDRVVTKTVYVVRESAVQKSSKKSSDSSSTLAVFGKKTSNKKDFAAPNLQMSGSIVENGYYTQTNLSDFEPVSETKIRIIRKEKADEK